MTSQTLARMGVALEYSQICHEDPDQLRWWCGQLLELEGQRRGSRTEVSRWEHAEYLVALRRAGETRAEATC